MKKFTYLFSTSITALLLVFAVMTGCEGPAGIAGIDGLDGLAGIDGIDGINGTDGTAACEACHNDETTVLARSLQAGNSIHMTGGHSTYGYRTDCSICHTHEGYIDRMESGLDEASSIIANPTPPNCRTCHKIHDSFTSADFDLRYPDPVTLWINDVTVDIGESNACASCHQPRVPDPLPVVGGDSVSITSGYWGVHYGPQSAILYGTAGYEIAGTEDYPSPGGTAHFGAGCITCHMADPYGDVAGGHTFAMNYVYHGSDMNYVEGCVACHSSATDFDIGDVQTTVGELIDSLETILENKGFLDGGHAVASSSTPLKIKSDEAGAMLNFILAEEDKSHGVHNPVYIQALLKNSIQAMSK